MIIFPNANIIWSIVPSIQLHKEKTIKPYSIYSDDNNKNKIDENDYR